MTTDEKIRKRFDELEKSMNELTVLAGQNKLNDALWRQWATSVMNLLHNSFGERTVHELLFRENYTAANVGGGLLFQRAKGIFLGAKSDFEGGYIFELQSLLTGEIVGDFVALAKRALDEGYKDVAAVLASAALEDALKRYARENDLNVDDEVMQTVVSALKSKGLVSGAQKSLLDTMPKIRDYAMHANWEKLTAADVGSIIGFVENFLLTHFS